MLGYYQELQQELCRTGAECLRAFRPDEDTCRIYEAEEPYRGVRQFLLAVRKSGESRLREDIALGRRQLRLGRMIYETTDFAQARRLADREYV